MMNTLKTLAALAVAAPALAGCATKGYVNNRLASERAITDSAISNERMARMAGDSTVMADVASLRQDLDSLRTEFGAKITALEEGVQFVFPVNFAFNDATVREQDTAALSRFARVVQKYYPTSTITVEGFADPAGSRSYNMDLSRRRAEAVQGFLAQQGLTNDLRAVGYGETRLVVPGAWGNDPGAEQNRRVVFVVESRGNTTEGVALTTPMSN